MADVGSLRVSASHLNWPVGSVGFTNHVVDASTEGVAWAVLARDTDAITHIGFRYGARTGTPPTFVATLESLVVTTGLPDGTDLGGGSPTAKTFTPPADATWDGTWQWVQLTNAYTPTRGQIIVPTIRYSSGTIDGSNNSSFTHILGSVAGHTLTAFPVSITNTSGTWGRQAQTPLVALRTASGRYGWPAEAVHSTRSASTVGHRRVLKFALPAGSGDTFTLRGLRFHGSIAAAVGKNPVMGLWDAGGLIQGVTLDSDLPGTLTNRTFEHLFDEASLTALSFGTTYYAGLEVADAVNGGVYFLGIELDDAADGDAYPGGSGWGQASFDGSSWTDELTIRPFVELILGDITEPAGGGGGLLIHPGMGGGLRG